MYQLSPAVLRSISILAKLDILKGDQGIPESLLHGVRNLSEMFTRGDGGGGKAYLEDQRLRASYLNYYVPVNVGKVPQGDVVVAFRAIRKRLQDEGLDGAAVMPRSPKDAVQADTRFSPQP